MIIRVYIVPYLTSNRYFALKKVLFFIRFTYKFSLFYYILKKSFLDILISLLSLLSFLDQLKAYYRLYLTINLLIDIS